ncbi:MAG: calcium-binding protein [Burkholderiales bacterium]|nr:calcium-binding protein [Burkholderiales bacterium]
MAIIQGTDASERLDGTAARDNIDGRGGADIIYGFGDVDNLYGGLGDDTIYGGDGNDTLDAFTLLGKGADSMIGGLGDDRYCVENVGDTVIELAGQGIDEVWSTIYSYTLPANVENLELRANDSAIGIGNALANEIIGNDFANRISGLDGNDSLLAYGGDDTLDGGNGDDTLDGGRGNDALYGGGGNDTLDGGDNGADSMTGGTGNDTYFVDNIGDKVIELAAQGTDTVSSKITYTLTANVENLTLTTSALINGTGNGLANVITGNAARNVLSGLDGDDTLNGGVGADSMIGGKGNDKYYVNERGDIVIESAGEGTDAVIASTSCVLAPNVENLTLTGSLGFDGTGNTVANVITGNDKSNVLSGLAGNDTLNGLAGSDTLLGGAGADVLIGGLGVDRFDFDAVSDSTSAARDAIRAGGGAIAFEGAGVSGGDVIDLSGIDANTNVGGDQAFASGFGIGLGQISLVSSGTTTLVRGNVDGDPDFEFVLAIEDGSVLASAYKAADFIL